MLPPTEISGHSDNRDNALTYYKAVISWIYSAGHSIEVIFVTVWDGIELEGEGSY